MSTNKVQSEKDFMQVYQELEQPKSSEDVTAHSLKTQTGELSNYNPKDMLKRLEAKRDFLSLIQKGGVDVPDVAESVDQAIADLKAIVSLLDDEAIG